MYKVHCFNLFLKCARCAVFIFTLTIYFTDTYGGVCWRNATALLSQAQWKAPAIACLIALLFTLLQYQINASGSWPTQNLKQILGFAICWNITGSKPCLMAENPKGQWSFPWFLWRSLNPLCDLPPTATLRSRFDSAMCRLSNQMQANILNPKPDGFPLLISL